MHDHRHVMRTIAVAAIVAVLAAAPRICGGVVAERTTYLTFTKPVRLPGVTLDPGTYIFELSDTLNAPGVVRVASRDRKISYFLGMTHAIERPRDLRFDASVSLGESPAGVAPPITVWWPVGERMGRQFPYPER